MQAAPPRVKRHQVPGKRDPPRFARTPRNEGLRIAQRANEPAEGSSTKALYGRRALGALERDSARLGCSSSSWRTPA
jgi:hypothetical protein